MTQEQANDKTGQEQNIAENEALLKILFENEDEAICVYNTDKIAVVFNRRFIEMYFSLFQQEPKVGTKVYSLLPENEVKMRDEQFDQVLQNKKISFELSYYGADGKRFLYKVKVSPLLVNDKVTGIATHSTNITEGYDAEQRLIKLNRELSLLNRINDAMIQIKDAPTLMNAVCNLLTEDSYYNLAWITFAPDHADLDNELQPVASSGPAQDFLNEIKINLADDALNRCPVSQCLLTGNTIVANNITKHEETEQPDTVKKYSIRATIALPLTLQEGKRGALAISSAKNEAFDSHEESILRRVAENLAFALKAIYALEEKKKAHAQLQMSLKELSIYKSALDRSFIVDASDPKGLITHVNDNMCRISQYTREELIGKTYDFVTGSTADISYRKDLLRTINSGNIWRGDIQHEAKDGTFYWVDTTIVPFMNEEGDIWQHLAIRVDTTQKRRDKEALAKSKANLHTIFDNAATGYVLVDEQLNIVSYNQAAAAFAAQELYHEAQVGDYMPTYFTEARREYLERSAYEVLTGRIFVFELNYQQQDGSMHWYNLRLLPIHNVEKQIYGLIVEITNITERINEEQERQKITNDLIYRNSALEQFTYIVSHNLRAPVASIIGLTSLLTEMELSDEEKEATIQGLATSAKKLDEVIVDINEILRIKNKVNDNKEQVSFTEITNEVEQYILQYHKSQPFTIVTDFAETDIYTSIKSYIYSIFYNLISNSIKYSNPGVPPVIEIKSAVDEKEQMITLFFKDNGIGINMEQNREQLFGIYRRFHSHVDGKGLGLFMVKTQLEMLGGTIAIESEEHAGTTFILKLPL